MFRILLFSLLGVFAGQAHAQSCPDVFRFVDFGVQDADGQFLRGGPVFRGENLDFQPMLFREKAICRDVRDLGKDGRGNPVPVVTEITYNIEKIGINLKSLRVSYSTDTLFAANENAKSHRQNLEDVVPVKGQNFLCAMSDDLLSCQVVSPYMKDADLVVYCDFDQCQMPVLAVTNTVQISADWAMDTKNWNEPERAGKAIVAKIQDIHSFFKPLTSGF